MLEKNLGLTLTSGYHLVWMASSDDGEKRLKQSRKTSVPG